MKNNKKAFTLIELLVVVLIIGILSAVALPQYTFAVEKARFAEAEQTVGALQKAIDIWLLETGGSSEWIHFLGTDANAQLSIDFEGSMDCSSTGECKSKNFDYNANLIDDSADVVACRKINGESPYCVTWIRDENGWHGDECDYYTDVSPIGEKICKMLEKQGNGFFACENC